MMGGFFVNTLNGNNERKRALSVVVASALCCVLCTSALAATSTDLATERWNFGSSYNGEQHGTYSPYKGEVVERMVSGDGVDRATFSFDAYFTFNQNIVDQLKNHRENGYHFTMDIANSNDNDKTMDCVYIYSTLPTAIPIKNANIQSHETMQRYQIKKLDCKLWE